MTSLKKVSLALFLLTAFSCAEDVSITLVAPETFARGSVAIDGRTVAEFERYTTSDKPTSINPLEERGAIARFTMSLGEHTIILSAPGQKAAAFRLNYDRVTEDHIAIDHKMITAAQVHRTKPLLLDELE